MIRLKQSDLDELRDSCSYLSDVIIEFYFTYLSSIHPSDSILYVPPSISFLLSNSTDGVAVEDCLKALELPSKNLIFFPVCRGKHWSLLVYHRESNSFVHHDSGLWGMNNSAARELYSTVKNRVHWIKFRNTRHGDGPQMQPEENEYDCGSSVPPQMRRGKFEYGCGLSVWSLMRRKKNEHGFGLFVCPKTPKQRNGYDCGLYVMAIAEAICRWFCEENDGKSWIKEINDMVDYSLVSLMRTHVLELITDASVGRLAPVSCFVEEERSPGVCSGDSDESRGLELHDDNIVRTLGGQIRKKLTKLMIFLGQIQMSFSDYGGVCAARSRAFSF